jgi:hypothetical protein
MQANGNGRLAAIVLRDKVIYGIIVVLFAILSFLASSMYTRLGAVELLLRETITARGMHEQRFSEDHALLLNIEMSRQQRTTSLKDLQDRLTRIETHFFHFP